MRNVDVRFDIDTSVSLFVDPAPPTCSDAIPTDLIEATQSPVSPAIAHVTVASVMKEPVSMSIVEVDPAPPTWSDTIPTDLIDTTQSPVSPAITPVTPSKENL